MSIIPYGDRVVVKPTPMVKKVGGLFIPDNAKMKPMEGTVISVGPGKMISDGTITPLPIKVGDIVLYGKFLGTLYKGESEDEDLLILRMDDILGKLDKTVEKEVPKEEKKQTKKKSC